MVGDVTQQQLALRMQQQQQQRQDLPERDDSSHAETTPTLKSHGQEELMQQRYALQQQAQLQQHYQAQQHHLRLQRAQSHQQFLTQQRQIQTQHAFIDLTQFEASSPAREASASPPPKRSRFDPALTPPPQLPEDAEAQRQLLTGIKDALLEQGRSAVFTCGGSLPMILEPGHRTETGDLTPRTDALMHEQRVVTKPVIIRWGEKGARECLRLPITSNKSAASFEHLISDCTPATFGRDGADVYDEEYRRAGAMRTEDFTTNFCPYECGIIDVVTQLLVPPIAAVASPASRRLGYGQQIYDEGELDQEQRVEENRMQYRGLRAELYKLNVYSAPSGHFKAHVDTPRSDTQVGSLVVCLPVPFSGGALAVRHGDQQIVHDWVASMQDPAIHWAAFYSDCEHEVMQVTTGHRVTLTYNLYLSPGTGRLCNRALSLEPRNLPVHNYLNAMLASQHFMPNGGLSRLPPPAPLPTHG